MDVNIVRSLFPQYFLLFAISCIGLERLNIWPMSGSFIQLFYLLSMPFLWVMWQEKLKNLQALYVVIMMMLAATLVVNGLFNAYYWKKFILIGYILATTFSLSAYIYLNGLENVLVRGLKVYVLLNLTLTCLQFVAFSRGDYLSVALDSTRAMNFDAVIIWDYFRPSGYSFDANKGMFNFSYALICLSLMSEVGWVWMRLLYPLTFLAHSRSTILSVLPALFARSKSYAIISVVLYISVLLYLTPQHVALDRLSSMDSTEQTFDSSSSNSMRLELLRLWGKGMSSSSSVQVLFGHGIASSGVYLSKTLGTNYGDFANGYLTYIYEFGLVGMAFLGFILVRLWRTYDSKSKYMLLVPLLIFQLFYANLAEPLILMTLSYFFLKNNTRWANMHYVGSVMRQR